MEIVTQRKLREEGKKYSQEKAEEFLRDMSKIIAETELNVAKFTFNGDRRTLVIDNNTADDAKKAYIKATDNVGIKYVSSKKDFDVLIELSKLEVADIQ